MISTKRMQELLLMQYLPDEYPALQVAAAKPILEKEMSRRFKRFRAIARKRGVKHILIESPYYDEIFVSPIQNGLIKNDFKILFGVIHSPMYPFSITEIDIQKWILSGSTLMYKNLAGSYKL